MYHIKLLKGKEKFFPFIMGEAFNNYNLFR